jgi:hypothetical protein
MKSCRMLSLCPKARELAAITIAATKIDIERAKPHCAEAGKFRHGIGSPFLLGILWGE